MIRKHRLKMTFQRLILPAICNFYILETKLLLKTNVRKPKSRGKIFLGIWFSKIKQKKTKIISGS